MNGAASGKSIEGLSPELPAADAARWTLKVRLRAVERMLGEVGEGGQAQEKPVHRLRVSTRRAAAAIRAYRAWIPDPGRRRTRRTLRRIRRAAASARLCDVQLTAFASLMREADPTLAGPIGVVLGRIAEQRREAGDKVAALVADPRCGIDAVRRLRKWLVRNIGDPDRDLTLMDLASSQIPELVGAMDQRGRADLQAIENVHELRIAGKRLRYAAEIFESCFAPDVHQTLLDRLTAFQDHLGELNDLGDMRARVEAFGADPIFDGPVREGLGRLAGDLALRVERAHAEFLGWWGGHGIESIVGGLPLPGAVPMRAASQRGAANGDLRTSIDRLIDDAVRHVT